MIRLQIPYRKVLFNPRDFDEADFDRVLRKYLEASRSSPVVIEVCNDNIQYLLFVNEGQLYYAAVNDGDHFRGIRLREFFSGIRRTAFPKVVAYDVDLALYHSLLVYLQNKPELKVSSALVDLDELLDRMEAESASAILTARQPGCFFLLRYQNGKASACYRERPDKRESCAEPREEFLVRVYTITARRPLEVNLFNDLTVTHAEDVRSIPREHEGTIASFFLSLPPRIIVRLKNRPLKTYPFTGEEVSIGRLPENVIVIDNLSVSRKHAVISMGANGYTLSDLGSKNGTLLNGLPVNTARLANGDIITIGKYELLFQIPSCEEGGPDTLDQTVIIPRSRLTPEQSTVAATCADGERPAPRLFRKSGMEEYPLDGEKLVIGKDRDSDIKVGGFFSPGLRVEVVRRGDDYVLQKVNGKRAVTINGEEMDEKVLEREDLIAIGSEEFVFKT
jgi:hypothetical protein